MADPSSRHDGDSVDLLTTTYGLDRVRRQAKALLDPVTRKINKGMLQARQRWEAYGRGLRALSKPSSGQP